MSADPATQRSTLTITLHHLEARDVRNTDTTRPSWVELTSGDATMRIVVEGGQTIELDRLDWLGAVARQGPITLTLGYGLALE